VLEIIGHGFIVEGLGTERGAEAAVAKGWKFCTDDEAFGVFHSIDQRDNDSVGTSVQSS
jgi:hypothetical protein